MDQRTSIGIVTGAPSEQLRPLADQVFQQLAGFDQEIASLPPAVTNFAKDGLAEHWLSQARDSDPQNITKRAIDLAKKATQDLAMPELLRTSYNSWTTAPDQFVNAINTNIQKFQYNGELDKQAFSAAVSKELMRQSAMPRQRAVSRETNLVDMLLFMKEAGVLKSEDIAYIDGTELISGLGVSSRLEQQGTSIADAQKSVTIFERVRSNAQSIFSDGKNPVSLISRIKTSDIGDVSLFQTQVKPKIQTKPIAPTPPKR